MSKSRQTSDEDQVAKEGMSTSTSSIFKAGMTLEEYIKRQEEKPETRGSPANSDNNQCEDREEELLDPMDAYEIKETDEDQEEESVDSTPRRRAAQVQTPHFNLVLQNASQVKDLPSLQRSREWGEYEQGVNTSRSEIRRNNFKISKRDVSHSPFRQQTDAQAILMQNTINAQANSSKKNKKYFDMVKSYLGNLQDHPLSQPKVQKVLTQMNTVNKHEPLVYESFNHTVYTKSLFPKINNPSASISNGPVAVGQKKLTPKNQHKTGQNGKGQTNYQKLKTHTNFFHSPYNTNFDMIASTKAPRHVDRLSNRFPLQPDRDDNVFLRGLDNMPLLSIRGSHPLRSKSKNLKNV